MAEAHPPSSAPTGGPPPWWQQDPTALTAKAIAEERIVFDDKLAALKEILIEKITGGNEIIKTRLDGNDTALVAALKAQKEEAAKQTENFKEVLGESKKGTEKQLDAISDKIGDMKDRLTRIEGMDLGSMRSRSSDHEGRIESHASNQNVIAVIAALVGALGFLTAIGSFMYTVTRTTPPTPTPVYQASPPPVITAPLLQHQMDELPQQFPTKGDLQHA